MPDLTPADLDRIDRAVAEVVGWGWLRPGIQRQEDPVQDWRDPPSSWSPTRDPADAHEAEKWAVERFGIAAVSVSYQGTEVRVGVAATRAASGAGVAPNKLIAYALAILELAGVDWRKGETK